MSISGFETSYDISKAGKGPVVKKQDHVTVHATGTVKESGYRFWSTKDAGQHPFSYTAGIGQVITGWDQGLLGAHLGEERKLEIPAAEGYGEKGFPAWSIPGGATLVFDLEVLKID